MKDSKQQSRSFSKLKALEIEITKKEWIRSKGGCGNTQEEQSAQLDRVNVTG